MDDKWKLKINETVGVRRLGVFNIVCIKPLSVRAYQLSCVYVLRIKILNLNRKTVMAIKLYMLLSPKISNTLNYDRWRRGYGGAGKSRWMFTNSRSRSDRHARALAPRSSPTTPRRNQWPVNCGKLESGIRFHAWYTCSRPLRDYRSFVRRVKSVWFVSVDDSLFTAQKSVGLNDQYFFNNGVQF